MTPSLAASATSHGKTPWHRMVALVVVMLSIFQSGCALIYKYSYQGDGDLRVNFLGYPTQRYRLRLGEFSSSIPTAACYKIGKLPPHKFQKILGITGIIRSPKLAQSDFEGNRLPLEGLANVKIQIRDLISGQIVSNEENCLSEFGWCSNSNLKAEPKLEDFIGTSLSRGWFEPESRHEYELTIRITHPDDYGLRFTLDLIGGRMAMF